MMSHDEQRITSFAEVRNIVTILTTVTLRTVHHCISFAELRNIVSVLITIIGDVNMTNNASLVLLK